MRLIRDLATYERASHEVAATEDDLHRCLFGAENPNVFAHVAEHDQTVVGFALWFLTFSTWTGTHGIYLEDLYVDPAMRGQGYGKALLTELARIARERGYQRVEWSVLSWNTPAIDFYSALGAKPTEQWNRYRLSSDAIADLARTPRLA